MEMKSFRNLVSDSEVVFNYLNSAHRGAENGILSSDICAVLGFKRRELRKCLQYINTSGKYNKIVSTTKKIYICESENECKETIRNTYRVAISLIKKARAMEKLLKLNGQLQTDFNGVTEIVRVLGD